MKKLIFMMLCVLFLFGCATNGMIVNVNGEPAPTNIMSGGVGPIKYLVVVTRHYDVMEGKEKRETFEYLPVDELIKLKEDTKALVVAIRILNPQKKVYTMWETNQTKYNEDPYPFTLIHQTYSGSLSFQEINRQLPLGKEISGAFKLDLKDTLDQVIATIGPVMYTKEKGGDGRMDRY